jgi:hypothetical protein
MVASVANAATCPTAKIASQTMGQNAKSVHFLMNRNVRSLMLQESH